MLRPFLFVGCGGSGVKTIRMIRRNIEQELRSRGVVGPIPDAWQFLAVDVPNIEDSPSDLLGVKGVRYVGLTDPHSTYRGADGADARLFGSRLTRDDYAGWRPDPAGVHTNIVVGAGQQRAVGRVVSGVFHNKLKGPIAQAATACTNGRAGLIECADALGIERKATNSQLQPIVVLISSLGGGAGSGIFLDIADMLRMSAEGNDTWLQNNLCSILYDPSVFDRDGTVLESGIAPNSLAAVSELVAGQWQPWARPTMLADFQGELGNYAGIEFPFLIGSSNGRISYGDPGEVYATVAGSLTTWVLDPDVSASVESFTFGNWGEKSAHSKLGLHGGVGTRMPLSALGFGRVGLGRGRFGVYAQERLARAAIERILTQHHTQEVRDGSQTDAEAAAQRVEQDGYRLVIDTLQRCGLDEYSETDVDAPSAVDSNQVLDAIRDSAEMADTLGRIREQVVRGVNDPREMVAQLENAVGDLFEGIPQFFLQRHRSRALQWSAEVQQRVLSETVRLIANEGLPVATLVLEQMVIRVGQEFPDQLIGEKSIVLEKGSSWRRRGEILKGIKNRGKTVSPAAANAVRALFESYAATAIEQDLRDLTAGLLRDLASGLLQPIHRELVNATETAKALQTEPEFRELADGPVPTRLMPPPNEVLLDPADQYPKTLGSLAEATSGSFDGAVADVVQGLYGTERSPDRAPATFRPTDLSPWIPKLAQDDGGTASDAKVALRMTASDLMGRAGYWMRSDVQTPVGRYMSMSLRDYLNDAKLTDAERSRRAKAFATGLDLCFDQARPLAELASQWTESTFGLSANQTFTYTLSPIPLTPGDSGYEEAAAVVSSRLGKSTVDREFATSARTEVEIFSTMKPLPPSAFASLVHPIASAWGSEIADHPRGNGKFWRHRRARPLDESLPLVESVRLTLARGWTTGLLAGLIRWDDHEQPCSIEFDGRRLEFLHPPISGMPASTDDEFASILEGALLSEFMAATGERQPLEALEALLAIGTAGTSPDATTDYRALNPVLVELLNASPDPTEAAREYAEELELSATALESAATNRDGQTSAYRLVMAPVQVRAMRDIAQAFTRSAEEPTTSSKRKLW